MSDNLLHWYRSLHELKISGMFCWYSKSKSRFLQTEQRNFNLCQHQFAENLFSAQTVNIIVKIETRIFVTFTMKDLFVSTDKTMACQTSFTQKNICGKISNPRLSRLLLAENVYRYSAKIEFIAQSTHKYKTNSTFHQHTCGQVMTLHRKCL